MLREKSAHANPYISFDPTTEVITVQFPENHPVGLHVYAIESFDTVAGEVRFTDVLAVDLIAVDPCLSVELTPVDITQTTVPVWLEVEITPTLQTQQLFAFDLAAEIIQTYKDTTYFTEGACNAEVEIYVIDSFDPLNPALPAPFIFEAPTASEPNYLFKVSTTDSTHAGLYTLEVRARLIGYPSIDVFA